MRRRKTGRRGTAWYFKDFGRGCRRNIQDSLQCSLSVRSALPARDGGWQRTANERHSRSQVSDGTCGNEGRECARRWLAGGHADRCSLQRSSRLGCFTKGASRGQEGSVRRREGCVLNVYVYLALYFGLGTPYLYGGPRNRKYLRSTLASPNHRKACRISGGVPDIPSRDKKLAGEFQAVVEKTRQDQTETARTKLGLA
jgi:hypothetical protein